MFLLFLCMLLQAQKEIFAGVFKYFGILLYYFKQSYMLHLCYILTMSERQGAVGEGGMRRGR